MQDEAWDFPPWETFSSFSFRSGQSYLVREAQVVAGAAETFGKRESVQVLSGLMGGMGQAKKNDCSTGVSKPAPALQRLES